MAAEKKDVAKKDVKKEKKPNRLARYLKEVAGEVKKLSWPTKKELVSYTLAVLAFVAVMAIIIGVLDLVFGVGYEQLMLAAGTAA